VPKEIQWEVLLIDNASTDDSAEVALKCWPQDSPTLLRIVREPQLGLSHARSRALKEAAFEVISFIDDDNWVIEEWVNTVSRVMSTHPRIGALGGLIDPVCEIEPPDWFERERHRYATMTETDVASFPQVICLCGAGLSIRKMAWEQLVSRGFQPTLNGRQGLQLSGGEDIELTFALYLAGWLLHIERNLKLYHFLPAHRLTWDYLRRLVRQNAIAVVPLDAYYFVDQFPASSIMNRLRQLWVWHLMNPLASIVRRSGTAVSAALRPSEGDGGVLVIEEAVGKIIGLLRLRGAYGRMRNEVREAPWRKRGSLRTRGAPRVCDYNAHADRL
jgi:glycosyltransferase involved in cell wall biosynthesis